jgi:hypothetical protein
MFSFISSRERFARRRTLSIATKHAIFTYIPKNACTTLRYSIAIANGRAEGAETISYLNSGMREMLASSTDLANCTYAFILLRCPYRRIASAFLDKAVNENSLAPPLFLPKLRLFRQSKFYTSEEAIATAHSKAMALTFTDFLAVLQRRGTSRLDQHFRPQSNFLLKQGYNEYFALENLIGAEAQLKEKLDLRLVDRGGNGVSRRKKSDVDASSLTIAELLELRAAGYAPTYESLFTDAARRAVDTFYATDLALYKKHFGSNRLLFPS